MWDFDSYRDFLREHTANHHAIGSAVVLLAAVCVLLFVLT